MEDARELILVDRLDDILLCRAAKGAMFSDTVMPSGLKIPRAPDGKAYYSTYRGLFHWLELRDKEE